MTDLAATAGRQSSGRLIEVFRPGTFVPMAGAPVTMTAADLEAVASAYDYAAAPAPIVIGHPSTDAPAYGWIRAMRFDAERQVLLAEADELAPEFSEAVAAGRYKRVSLSFFRPGAPANPKPGRWYPKHLGFLGAAPPAVTGLKPVAFAAADPARDLATFEFGAAADHAGTRESAGLFRRLREFVIEKFGAADADRVLPDWEIRFLEEAEEPPLPGPSFTLPATSEEFMAETPPDFAAREAELTRREAELTRRLADATHAEHVAFAARLSDDGRILPSQAADLVAVLDAVSAGDVSFSGGSVTDGLRRLLEGLPQAVTFGRLPTATPGEGEASFSAPDDRPADAERLAIHNRALAYQRQHPGTAYLDAVRAVATS